MWGLVWVVGFRKGEVFGGETVVIADVGAASSGGDYMLACRGIDTFEAGYCRLQVYSWYSRRSQWDDVVKIKV